MAEQRTASALQLPFDVPATPKLTPKQAHALDLLRGFGTDGLDAVTLGALMHDHPAGHRCDYCLSNGNQMLRALRRKGVARQRRVDGHTFWQATGLPAEPMGDLPEGF